MTSVSMIVIAFNEEATIVPTLQAIQAMQDFPGDHEIIVVDDGSTDGTPLAVRAYAGDDARIRCITQPNQGRGAARAKGVDAASTTGAIGFVDADILLPTDWWARCTAALREYDAVGGTAVPDGDVSFVYRTLGLHPRVAPHTTTVSGGNGLFTSEVFERVSFDPALRNGEDVALNHAMAACGVRMATIDGLLVVHNERKGYLRSCAWLAESGVGATRQFFAYRTVRTPDLVAAAFAAVLVASIAGAWASLWWLLLAPAFVLIAAAAHLHSKFRLAATPARSVVAIAVHSPLMACYLVGRLWGLVRVGARP